MRYKVETATSVGDLEIQVERSLKVGWKPLGGLALKARKGFTTTYYQTLILENEKNGD